MPSFDALNVKINTLVSPTFHLIIVKIANVKGVGGIHFTSWWNQRRIIPKPIEPLPIHFFEPFVALRWNQTNVQSKQ